MQISERSLQNSKYNNLIRLAKYLKLDIKENIDQKELANVIFWHLNWLHIK